ncbi:hypothetical protein V5F40_22695 [Xanthobacter sp. DSM 14520]|uniref:hypothetical protein n=1 Tax=Xanthobacter autotrophicus (strain ATCC BAA-1158 / Py2) TaxID=78245 RepID=UPI003728B313
MMSAWSRVCAVVRSDGGATVVEYGVLTLGIVAVALSATISLTGAMTDFITRVSDAISAVQ